MSGTIVEKFFRQTVNKLVYMLKIESGMEVGDGSTPGIVRCLLLSPAMRSNAGMANRQGDVDLRESLLRQLTLWLGLVWLLQSS